MWMQLWWKKHEIIDESAVGQCCQIDYAIENDFFVSDKICMNGTKSWLIEDSFWDTHRTKRQSSQKYEQKKKKIQSELNFNWNLIEPNTVWNTIIQLIAMQTAKIECEMKSMEDWKEETMVNWMQMSTVLERQQSNRFFHSRRVAFQSHLLFFFFSSTQLLLFD